jgi:hypothetical protein
VLDGIESAKAILDAGGSWVCNLMGIFPGQTLESIAEEAHFITASMHLIKQCLAFAFFPYYANSRDEIAGNAERFHMVTKQDQNIWPKMAFDVELPLSLFEWQWKDSREGPEGDLSRAWHDMMLGETSLLLTMGKLLYHSIRAHDFAYLNRLLALRLKSRGKGSFTVGRGKSPVLALDGDELHMRGHGWLARERRVRLSEAEIVLLREAYFVRKTAELKTSVANKLNRTEAEIGALIDAHVKLGTLVMHKAQVVSAVRDPAYLKQRRATVKAPVTRCAEPPLVSVSSLVRPAVA